MFLVQQHRNKHCLSTGRGDFFFCHYVLNSQNYIKMSLGRELWRAVVHSPAQSLPFRLLGVLSRDSESAPEEGNGTEWFHLKCLRALESPERSFSAKLLWVQLCWAALGVLERGNSQKFSVPTTIICPEMGLAVPKPKPSFLGNTKINPISCPQEKLLCCIQHWGEQEPPQRGIFSRFGVCSYIENILSSSLAGSGFRWKTPRRAIAGGTQTFAF